MYCQKSYMLFMVMNVGRPLSAAADEIANDLYRQQCEEQDHLE